MKTRKALGASRNMLQHGVALLAATTCLAALADDEAYLAVVDSKESSSYTNSVNWRKWRRHETTARMASSASDRQTYLVAVRDNARGSLFR